MNLENSSYKKISVFCGLLAFFIIALQLLRGYFLCEHQFIYSTDDTYIHMAIARNLAYYKVWSTNQDFFTSSSSSFLYTILLAVGFKFFGNHQYYPYVLNFVPYFLLFVVIYKYYAEQISKQKFLAINIFLISIFPLPLFAMEHSLHVLFILLFLLEFDKFIAGSKNMLLLFLLGFILTMLRYESMFILFSAFLILVYNKKIIPAFLLMLIGFSPIIIYGMYSVQHGSYFLPNTLVTKGNFIEPNLQGILAFIIKVVFDFTVNIHFTIYIILVGIYFWKQRFKTTHWSFLIVLLTTGAHLLFAGVLHFYRYEAYLIVPIVLYFIAYFYNDEQALYLSKSKLSSVLKTVFIVSVVFRLAFNIWIIQMAPKNIYEQQIQFSKFLKKYYDKQAVLVHDIGYLAFSTDVKIYDIAGIATLDVAATKTKKFHFKPGFIDQQQEKYGFKIGVFYDIFANNGMPKTWIKAGEWKINHNRVCGLSKINFYAVDSAQFYILKQQLKEYTPFLNKNVEQKIY
ncbi:MAG TPA: hypothetical protein PK431_06860 [Chitinophagales bacterium]|nr:hypothetical protein [Chitinophagales bacterium]